MEWLIRGCPIIVRLISVADFCRNLQGLQESRSFTSRKIAFHPGLLSRPSLEPGQKARTRRPVTHEPFYPGFLGAFVPVCGWNRDKRVHGLLAALLFRFQPQTGTEALCLYICQPPSPPPQFCPTFFPWCKRWMFPPNFFSFTCISCVWWNVCETIATWVQLLIRFLLFFVFKCPKRLATIFLSLLHGTNFSIVIAFDI